MLSHHRQDRGTLSYVEFRDLKFNPKRMYLIHGVPKGEIRGNHAHKQDKQYLTCVKGKIRVKLISKEGTTETILTSGESVFMDKNVWGEQEYLTGDDVLLVLNSTNFDPDDYIHNIDEVLR